MIVHKVGHCHVINPADTAWLMTATALVVHCALPGLALFYGGLVQAKNVLSVLVQCCAVAAMISVLWFAVGYSLAFSGSGDLIGDGAFFFLRQIARGAVHPGTHIPESVFVMFQMTFAIITPALIIVCLCRRIRFSAVLLISALWPAAGLCAGGPLGVGRRLAGQGRRDGLCRRHRGACDGGLLGAGDRLGAAAALGLSPQCAPAACALDGDGGRFAAVGGLVRIQCRQRAVVRRRCTGMAPLATHLSAAAATLVWMAIEWVKFGKPSLVGAVTGTIAGLATVTPASISGPSKVVLGQRGELSSVIWQSIWSNG